MKAKFFHWRTFLILFLALATSLATSGIARGAGLAGPAVPPTPPQALGVTPEQLSIASTVTPLVLPPLKAVLVVGPIDGNSGEWTQSEISNMELAADELEANGVVVYRFYTPNNSWDQIRAAAEGAQFFFYRGHGVYWSDFPHPNVGGLALNNNVFISSDQLRSDLHLAPNAIIMIYGCFAAGSSSADTTDIGVDEARRRVGQYSDPFFDNGAAGYYSDWFGDAFQMYVRYLFQGQTLGQAYESYWDFNAATVARTTHPDHPEMAMWLDKDNWRGYWEYDNAFVGRPNETLQTLFVPPTLGHVPEDVTFIYSIPDGQITRSSLQVQPRNVTTEDPLNWVLSFEGNWFTVTESSGTTPDPFDIVLTSFSTDVTFTYTGLVTVTVLTPEKTAASPYQIEVRLIITDKSLNYVYLPMVACDYQP